MSKKLLKARYSYSASRHHAKPLSVVEPLKVKDLSDLLTNNNNNDFEEQSSKVLVPPPLESNVSTWEYKPWGFSAGSRQFNFRLHLNGLSVAPEKSPVASFASSMSSPEHPLPLSSSSSAAKKLSRSNVIICDSDSEFSSSSNWSSRSSLDQKPGGTSSESPPVNYNRDRSVSDQQGLYEEDEYLPQQSSSSVFQRRQTSGAILNSSLAGNRKMISSTSREEPKTRGGGEDSSSRKRKKEDNLLPKNCKFSRFEIVDAPIDTFNKLLEKLPNDEKMVFKDSRRKGKNRGAARRARDRRILQHEQLIKQKEVAMKELSLKKQEHKELEEECQIWAKLVDTINFHIRNLELKLK